MDMPKSARHNGPPRIKGSQMSPDVLRMRVKLTSAVKKTAQNFQGGKGGDRPIGGRGLILACEHRCEHYISYFGIDGIRQVPFQIAVKTNHMRDFFVLNLYSVH